MSRSPKFTQQLQPQISGINPYVPGKPISELKRELNLVRVSKLASNENPLGASQKAKTAVQELIIDIASYPDGSAFELKKALASFLAVSDKQVSVGNGSNELLELVARIFAGKGDEIIFSQYAFAVYPISAQVVGATSVCVPALNWGHDLEAMLAAITEKTKVIYIANPNNPTGTLISVSEWEAFISQVPEHIIVVLDEAYFEFVQTGKTVNGLDYLAEYDNLLVSRTFSKAYGLASLRVGYMVGGEELIGYIEKVRMPFNVNQFAQVAAIAALNDPQFVKTVVSNNQAGMAQLTSFCQGLKLSFIPSYGNFVCIQVGPKALEINQALLALGVIVRPVSNYGLDEYLRVSIGSPKENQHFMDALTSILSQNQAGNNANH